MLLLVVESSQVEPEIFERRFRLDDVCNRLSLLIRPGLRRCLATRIVLTLSFLFQLFLQKLQRNKNRTHCSMLRLQ